MNIISSEHENQSKASRIWAWAAGIALLITAAGLGLLLYWSSASEDVLMVKNSPFPVRTIADGSQEYVIIEADYCKNTSIDGQLRMSFVSKTKETFLPITPERLDKGCKATTFPVPIPKSLEPDTYKIRFRALYDINPLKQDIPIEFESQKFQVGQQ